MKKMFLVFALAAGLTACNNANKKETVEQKDTDVVQTETLNADLFGTDWKLLELNGIAVKVDTTFKKEPFLMLEKDGGKINGNGGCNGFMGTYTLKENNELELKLGGSTMMACPNLELENQFHEALGQTKSYRIEGNYLMLDNADKTPVAKLEASKK